MILLYIIITLDLSSVVYNVKVDFIYTFFNILLAASFRINYIIEERKKKGKWKFKYNVYLAPLLFVSVFNYIGLISLNIYCHRLLLFLMIVPEAIILFILTWFFCQFRFVFLLIGCFYKEQDMSFKGKTGNIEWNF